MSRRKARKPCPVVDKASYRDEASALRLGEGVLRARQQSEAARHLPLAGLWVYPCRHCERWHLTSQDQHDERRRVRWPHEVDEREAAARYAARNARPHIGQSALRAHEQRRARRVG